MRPSTMSVRRAWFAVASFAVAATAEAQVAIQVKSGTTWTSNLELKALAPITFRWRWDGAETPTSVAWQLATVTPTSTATTRASDNIASETALKLPAKAGAYEEFTVTPSTGWPSKFYIRVRVNVGRKSVYSRWSTVSVVSRAAFVTNPTCAIKGWKYNGPDSHVWDNSDYEMFIVPEETVVWPPWGRIWVHFIVHNASRSEARYRRGITVVKNGVNQKDEILRHPHPSQFEPTTIRSVGAGKADTVTIGRYPTSSTAWYLMSADGGGTDTYDMILTLMPLEGPDSKCTLHFYAK